MKDRLSENCIPPNLKKLVTKQKKFHEYNIEDGFNSSDNFCSMENLYVYIHSWTLKIAPQEGKEIQSRNFVDKKKNM